MGDVEKFLSHYGVKGMQWGVRRRDRQLNKAVRFDKKAQDLQSMVDKIDANPSKYALGRRDQSMTKRMLLKEKAQAEKDATKKREGKLSSDEVRRLVMGAVVAGILVSALGSRKASSLPRSAPKSVTDLINEERHSQASSMKRMFEEGHMTQEQYSKFSETLHKRYDRRIADAVKEGLG